jgi:uncharacterized protein
MWIAIARLILRNRFLFLTIIVLITAFMGYKATNTAISYTILNVIPEKDSTFIHDQRFRRIFKEDVNILVLGVQDTSFFQKEKYNDWLKMGDSISELDGVEGLASVAHMVNIEKNKEEKRFEIRPLGGKPVQSQEELDSLKSVIHSLPFYEGFLFNDSAKVYVMGITINEALLNSRDREEVVFKIEELSNNFGKKHNIQIHHSGLPYTRTIIAQKIREELVMFIILALIVTAVILYLFFRSFRVVVFSMLIVSIAVVWAFGSIVLFGYQISVLSGMIPPLIIVIGIPNCIYFLNKYQQEYRSHGNKIMAMQRVIRKIGKAAFLTNLTTALGFATFIITNSEILIEFGVIASLNIMGVFLLSLTMIPIIFTFLPPPKARHTSHLDNKLINQSVDLFVHMIVHHRRSVFIGTSIVLLFAFYGIRLMHTTGYIVDDISKEHKVVKDLRFFEEHFDGVMPLEIMINTGKPKGVIKLSTLKKIEKLEKILAEHPELSKTISIVDAIKYAKQAYYNGKESYYNLPSNTEKSFILAYLSKDQDRSGLLRNFVDSTAQYARITTKIADIGTVRMRELYPQLLDEIYTVFPPEKYEASLVGASVAYFKGTGYLIKNLFTSLLLAIILIAIFMAAMFSSFRMVLASLIPNLIPLIITAAVMGYFGIPIKPSTVLVFSIAFGISVDDTIHFLAKYRQELTLTNWNIGKSVILALRETGVSMMYTSIVLFFGFSIFIASTFGGTVALGILVSMTLLVAMFANLVILPSLLLSLEKRITTKSFREPLLHVFDEEEDIEMDDLKISEGSKRNS